MKKELKTKHSATKPSRKIQTKSISPSDKRNNDVIIKFLVQISYVTKLDHREQGMTEIAHPVSHLKRSLKQLCLPLLILAQRNIVQTLSSIGVFDQ